MSDNKNSSSALEFYVNGKKIIDGNVDPEWTLLYYLRTKLQLCGTKLGCAEGGCGACTVMISKYDREKKKIKHLAVNACLAPICSMHGLAVTTVEGIGSTKTKLHPVQERIAKAHGSQCGFCTPGIVMSMYTLLRNQLKPSMKDLEIAFQGNLCRCTGYRAIIEGYKTFTENWEIIQQTNGIQNENGFCSMSEKCCRNTKKEMNFVEEKLFEKNEFVPYDPSQEPIFPPELKLNARLDTENLIMKGPNVTWYRPTTLDEVLRLKETFPDAKIVVGNSEVGVEVKFRRIIYPNIIHPVLVPEMLKMEVNETGIKIGAAVPLLEMGYFLENQIEQLPNYKTKIFEQVVEMLHYFAGKQIRSVGCVGGNIMTGSPISDLNPIFLAAVIKLKLNSYKDGRRDVLFDENFFTGYRRNIVKPNEILESIQIPFTEKNQFFYAQKQARRRDDDIAIVNCAINVKFVVPETNEIEDIKLVYGGMAPITKIALKTCKNLVGRKWDRTTLDFALDSLAEEMALPPSVPGGMAEYRQSLSLSFFFRFFLKIYKELGEQFGTNGLTKSDMSALDSFHAKTPKSSQYFQVNPRDNSYDTVSRPIIHSSAYKQACGEAVYCDDIPKTKGELYMGLVLSTKSHAKILSLDPTPALSIDGVRYFFSAKDLPKERNKFGPVFHDEQVFISDKVTSQGQLIGIVLAEDQLTAQRAAKAVKIDYEELQPIIITMEDAIKHESFFEIKRKMEQGDVDQVFKTAPHVIEGQCRTGAQEHFYLETNAVLVVPKNEDDELEVYVSSQNPSEINKLIAEVLDIPQNRIAVRVKRLGGGFGGKESRSVSIAVPAALAALKTGKAIRCMLDRDEDISITGTRHPFLIKYKVAFDNDGKILGAEVYIYNNCGYSYDLSLSVLERAIFHYENAYKIPNCRIFGFLCKTNLPSNTAFRGFGGPQGMFAAENMAKDIADYLGKDFQQVSEINLYREEDRTHYNQLLTNCTIRKCWDECIKMSNYHRRRKEIDVFNKENRWKKRGIAIIPTKFGIAFTALFMNQAGALIHVYTDGSVLLSHGGTEMGQGLHVKMIQVASKVLQIPTDKIFISETSTDKVPNTSPTAASSGSDLNGMAVMNACKVIKERLEPFVKKNPEGKWEDWVKSAYFERVSLSSTGFYKTPDIGYNWETNSGHPFNYFTIGAGCAEVEIDCLTGDHQVLRSDIVMDLGESLNPAIDIGQIEGAFMQGYGLFVLEEMVYSPDGFIFTKGPGAYKLPGFADIPLEFNVSLLKGVSNPKAVYSSKAVGEPPLFLASSAFFAIKDAIGYARIDAGLQRAFHLDSPATSSRIRVACQDHITKRIKETEPNALFKPWNVVP